MPRVARLSMLVLSSMLLSVPSPAPAQDAAARPHAGMLRYPDISAAHIVFAYGGDLWIVDRNGGTASPLASPPGGELYPRFSPDGATIAFAGNYDGNQDIYTVPVAGGVPQRLTHHPAPEYPSGWTPDGRVIFTTNGHADLRRQSEILTVAATGGMPTRLPVPYGANGAISGDGRWLAYTPNSRDHRTWKRYRGGLASDIWMIDLETKSSRRVTDWEGTDSQPMWHGGRLWYMSDAGPAHRLNLWVFDPASGAHEQVTFATADDVKWPAIGPGPDGGGEIVFQQGASLRVLDLRSRKTRDVEVRVPGARNALRSRRVDASKNITSWRPSPTGKRAVVSARGDLWTLPAKDGPARNLTRTSGVAERDPSWSADGAWLAYFSDESGEHELYVRSADGRGEARRLTHLGAGFRYAPSWAPDGKTLAYTDSAGGIFTIDVESGNIAEIDRHAGGGRTRLSWSHDSGWLTYAVPGAGLHDVIVLYDARNATRTQVTSGMFADAAPVFDREGDYLYFTSMRSFTKPQYEDVGSTFVYAGTGQLFAVPLRADVERPFAPKSDEEEVAKQTDESESTTEESDDETTEETDAADGESEEDAEDEPLAIDIEGFESRAVLLPVDAGRLARLAVNDKGQLLYARTVPGGGPGKAKIQLFDATADKPEEKTVFEGTGQFVMTSDGKRLLVKKGSDTAFVDAAPDQKMKDKVPTGGMHTLVEPREEWTQILRDAWRIQRDFFYVENMHGLDWPAVHAHYAQMLPDCTTRSDVSYVIRELISELNVGHAYYWGGDEESAESVSVGMLGLDFSLVDGAYRIERVVSGAAWDADARNPLEKAGVDVSTGDFLLTVNGVRMDVAKDPWAAFQGLAGTTAMLGVADSASGDNSRDVLVRLAANEGALRYRAWVERNRAYVAEKTGGRVGYIHVPDTGRNGQNELFRQFYGQTHAQALIVDERWNGGGQIPTRFIELLNRPITNYWARRHGRDWSWPYDAHQGPKCMLINGNAGSGGDAFPAYFRQAGLGKLIGRRTWGGLVGISGNPGLIDGGYTAVPTFGYYESDGTWGIEGHGVDPDIEVLDDPGQMQNGADPQLDAGIAHMLDELKRIPYRKPERPSSPDRSGMGVSDDDK